MKARILVVEDEQEVRELLTEILESEDHEVKSSSNGSQALQLFKNNHFDLVFTDLGMPGMTGWQVAKEIKRINGATPVSVITGWRVTIDDNELKERGVDFIVNKPFQIKQLLWLVQASMSLKEKQEGG
jgi:CheY-like chemotaxis protein